MRTRKQITEIYFYDKYPSFFNRLDLVISIELFFYFIFLLFFSNIYLKISFLIIIIFVCIQEIILKYCMVIHKIKSK